MIQVEPTASRTDSPGAERVDDVVADEPADDEQEDADQEKSAAPTFRSMAGRRLNASQMAAGVAGERRSG